MLVDIGTRRTVPGEGKLLISELGFSPVQFAQFEGDL
jgi:hypothetical protein